jgi:hypothetical protein
MNDFELMQYWRAIKQPQREIEQRVLTFGHAVYEQAYKEAREELRHSFYSGMARGHEDCKPALTEGTECSRQCLLYVEDPTRHARSRG